MDREVDVVALVDAILHDLGAGRAAERVADRKIQRAFFSGGCDERVQVGRLDVAGCAILAGGRCEEEQRQRRRRGDDPRKRHQT
jgi:hypothetical protein